MSMQRYGRGPYRQSKSEALACWQWTAALIDGTISGLWCPMQAVVLI